MTNSSKDSRLGASNVLTEMLAERRALGRSGRVFEGLGSMSSRNNLFALREMFFHFRPSRTLEVGFAFGASALLLTEAHRESGEAPCRQHTALDPYQSTAWDDVGVLQIERAGLSGFLDFRASSSCAELPRLLDSQVRFGLIYVDGSHLFEDVFVDAYYGARLLEVGGVLAFDDCTNPNVAKVVKFLRRNCRGFFRELDLSSFRPRKEMRRIYLLARSLGRVQMRAFQLVGNPVRDWDAPFRHF